MGRRRPPEKPDAAAIADEIGLSLASEAMGEAIYNAARRLRIVSDLRGWDEHRGAQEYGGGTWQTYAPGLQQSEKNAWRLLAAIAQVAE